MEGNGLKEDETLEEVDRPRRGRGCNKCETHQHTIKGILAARWNELGTRRCIKTVSGKATETQTPQALTLHQVKPRRPFSSLLCKPRICFLFTLPFEKTNTWNIQPLCPGIMQRNHGPSGNSNKTSQFFVFMLPFQK